MLEYLKSIYEIMIMNLYKHDILTFKDYNKAKKRLDKKFEVFKK